MHDGGMVAVAKFDADLGQSHVEQGTAEKHGDLARICDVFAAAVGLEVFDGYMIETRNNVHDHAGIDLFAGHRLDDVFQCFCRHVGGDRAGQQ